jgi:hypothetical protein
LKTIAILVGVAQYAAQPQLPCCAEDVRAIRALLEATARFDDIHEIMNPTADTLKERLRVALNMDDVPCRELFFYFSGHGYDADSVFYFCTSDFNARQPNVTGLSGPDLHNLFRSASPDLVVTVIDACHSGSPLIKRHGNFHPVPKGEFSNFIQIASCQRSQMSSTGDPLSDFTESFCLAATGKETGPVYYTDINAGLRDRYIDDEERTPHFVTQVSGREMFVSDTRSLDTFRERFEKEWQSKITPGPDQEDHEDEPDISLVEFAVVEAESPPQTLASILAAKESQIAKPDDVKTFIDALIDHLIARVREVDLAEVFDLEITESADFDEHTPVAFMTKILSKEQRPDEFVTATVKRDRKKRGPLDFSLALTGLYTDNDWVENFDLSLNMRLSRAQVLITLMPRFTAMQKFTLVLTCAPSLERCYVFASCTRLARTDWEHFAYEGPEVIRRWFQAEWTKSGSWIVEDIVGRLQTAVQTYVASLTAKLQDE